MKTPFFLITGFLGSGKTTLLKKIIAQYDQNKKIAVIQNEFAPSNIDGTELKRTSEKNFDLLEINNGSVFCVCLLSGFIKSLSDFLNKYNPDVIFMEASGLSDPVSIGEIITSREVNHKIFLAGNICVVDAKNILKLLPLQQGIKHQVMMADQIIINKCDLTSNTDDITQLIESLNPYGIKHYTSFCELKSDHILSLENKNTNQNIFLFAGSGRPDISAVVLKTSKPVRSELINELFIKLKDIAIRFKGFIITTEYEVIAVNSVFSEIKFDKIKTDIKQTELIAIGKDLNIKDLKERYMQFV